MSQKKSDERRDFKLREQDGELKFNSMHLGGGIISNQQIDEIEKYPRINKIQISGLNNDTLQYFVSKYGNQFRRIYLFKNPKISNLEPLSKLSNVEELEFYWNQKATQLWDMSKNHKMETLKLYDFKKELDVSLISTSKNLLHLYFGNMVPHGKTVINSTKPLAQLIQLTKLHLGVDKIVDNDYTVFEKMKNLEYLFVPANFYKLDVFAWLKVHLNKKAADQLEAPIEILEKPYDFGDKIIDRYGIGKGKRRWLNSEIDKKIIAKMELEFQNYYDKFKSDKNLMPE